MRRLSIEDRPHPDDCLRQRLNKSGFAVQLARDGSEALRRARTGEWSPLASSRRVDDGRTKDDSDEHETAIVNATTDVLEALKPAKPSFDFNARHCN